MTPLGDGHGPEPTKFPAKRFLTTPEVGADIARRVAEHEAFIDAIEDPVKQYEAVMLGMEAGARVLARLGATYLPIVAPQASVIQASLEAIADTVRKES